MISHADPAEFDAAYRRAEGFLYGDAPVPELKALVESGRVTVPGRVLDLGCGDGRNALYLAQRGLDVDAVDTAPRAIQRLRSVARQEHLPIMARVQDVRALPYRAAWYSLIVAYTILDHLDRSDGDALVPLITRALAPGGLLFAGVFTTDDPGHTGMGRQSETARFVQRYYAPGELCPAVQRSGSDRL